MSWETTVTTIPHVFELIFSYLSVRDLLAAAQVCQQWETAIFGSRELTKNLAWNIIKPAGPRPKRKSCARKLAQRFLRSIGLRGKDADFGQQLLSTEEISRTTRQLDGVILSPRCGTYGGDLTNVVDVLRKLNGKHPIDWIRVDGTFEKKIIIPRALMAFGSVLKSLQHLDLTLTLNSFFQPDWLRTFEEFPNLKSLTLTNGHVRVLKSIRYYCQGLTKLVLRRFAFNLPLDDLLNFCELEELVIDELDIFPWFIGESQITLPKLKHLTILMSVKVDTEDLDVPPITINAPLLQTAKLSDILHHFVRLNSGDHLQAFTLNVTSTPGIFLTARMFHGRLHNVTTVTIESNNLKGCYLVMALAWIKQQCPKAARLVFVQDFEPPLDEIRVFVATEMPNLLEVSYEQRELEWVTL